MSKEHDKRDALILRRISEGVNTTAELVSMTKLSQSLVLGSLRRLTNSSAVYTTLIVKEYGGKHSTDKINQYHAFDASKSVFAQMVVTQPIDVYLYPKLAKEAGYSL